MANKSVLQTIVELLTVIPAVAKLFKKREPKAEPIKPGKSPWEESTPCQRHVARREPPWQP